MTAALIFAVTWPSVPVVGAWLYFRRSRRAVEETER